MYYHYVKSLFAMLQIVVTRILCMTTYFITALKKYKINFSGPRGRAVKSAVS